MEGSMKAGRWKCSECQEVVSAEQVMEAPDPFDSTLLVFGCQSCRMCVEFELVCDEAGCSSTVSCGWPSASGYRQTCSEHSGWDARKTTS